VRLKRKVPGEVPAIGRMTHEAATFEESLEKRSLADLKDLLIRQKKIEGNKALRKNLPDGGERITRRRKQIEELIERKERESDVASALLAGLSINGEKVSSVEEMEWKYGSSGLQSRLQRPHVDPDDGDGGASNMLAALAEREVPSSYSLKLAAKDSSGKGKRFMPFVSVKSETLNEEKAGEIGLQRSSATARQSRPKPEGLMPMPEIRLGVAKTVSIAESLEIQKTASVRMKEAMAKQAADRLSKSQTKTEDIESPAVLFDGGMGHRSNAELDSDDEEVQEDQDGE